MRLTQAEFNTLKAANQLRIALIGMSNVGKSHWASQITELHNFKSYEVDAAIQEHLFLGSITQSARWMGHPYEDGYVEKSSRYLQLEAEQTLAAKAMGGNVVLDTTGSVIHLRDDEKIELHNTYLIVYLKVNGAAHKTLVQRFEKTPKPLIWGDHYTAYAGMSDRQSLLASYPTLLTARAQLYDQLADVVMDVDALKDTHTTDFIVALQSALPEH